jgi:hypothetical protein
VRRATLTALGAIASLLLFTAVASAAAPTVGPVTVTDIQGVSALAKSQVNPGGQATTYAFEYDDQAGFTSASRTLTTPVGEGSTLREARGAFSGLGPGTTYHVRIVATNAAGTDESEATFETTQGFGFLPGEEGFSSQAIADGAGPATAAGSHPYQLNLDLGFKAGGEFENQPGAVFPDGDLRNLRIQLPSGMILNPSVVPTCSAEEFGATRSSPFEFSLAGEKPGRHGRRAHRPQRRRNPPLRPL